MHSKSDDKDMNKKIKWLRISYWTGAVIDALAAVQMLSPKLFAVTNHLNNFQPKAEYGYAMGMGASLMIGWTVLLLWADRKPLERKGVLIITIIPVIFGMIINEIIGVQHRFLSAGALWPIWILQVVLVLLFGYGCFSATITKNWRKGYRVKNH
jgi:hypothetical protein